MISRNKNGTFAKGKVANPNGRPKGSRNKYTKKMLETAMQHLLEKDFNPINELFKLYNSTEDEGLKHKILNDILKFTNNPVYVEEDDSGNPVLLENIDSSIAELKQKIDEL